MKEISLRLTELTKITTGHPFRGRILEKSGSGIRAVQMKDVSVENGVCWETVIETELLGKKQPDWLIDHDILFAARGSRNYAVLIDQVTGKVVSSPHFYILRVTYSSLLPEFLAWQLNQKLLQNYFDKTAEGTVTRSVRRSILESTDIVVPTLEVQKQILGLHRTLMAEKEICAQLSRNADKLMNSIASSVLSGKTK